MSKAVKKEPPQTTEDTIATMATLLRTMGTDLGDEREVIRALIGARFPSGDVMLFMDRAIERARAAEQSAEGQRLWAAMHSIADC